ncbi:MAG: metalloregulator ArsR/SmtB family transcription factor [Dongiaceae bacterium]
MVKSQEPVLDRTFAALADPTRRALLARLGDQDGLSVSELARPLPMSLPAVMKHLDVLTDARLIERTKTGRTVLCRLTAGPMEQAMQWLDRYQRFWTDRLDRLAALMEEETCPPSLATIQGTPPSPASPSSAGSTQHRRKSTRPGPTRR